MSRKGLLVLSRQKDESIIIGDDVEIIVVDIRGDKVRLGVNAPRSMSVHRKEVWESIRQERGDAGQSLETPTVKDEIQLLLNHVKDRLAGGDVPPAVLDELRTAGQAFVDTLRLILKINP